MTGPSHSRTTQKTRVKVGLRNGILRKLTNTKWGVDAKTVRATALLPLQ